jgi:hypothetical protein
MIRPAKAVGALLLIAIGAGTAFAQDPASEPAFQELVGLVRSRAISLGLTIQLVGDYHPGEQTNAADGFSIPRARAKLSGELDWGLSYLLQADFIRSPVLTDARLSVQVDSAVAVDAGLFKAPFSGETLTSFTEIDLANRSRVTRALAPSRQIGVQLRGTVLTDLVEYRVGAFNGNGVRATNDDDRLLFAGRLALRSHPFAAGSGENLFEIGVNAAKSRDSTIALTSGLPDPFRGERELVGADLRVEYRSIFIAAEVITATLELAATGARTHPKGYHATAGWVVSPRAELVARFDSFERNGGDEEPDLVIVGFNARPTRPLKFQANVVLPTRRDVDSTQLLFNTILAF